MIILPISRLKRDFKIVRYILYFEIIITPLIDTDQWLGNLYNKSLLASMAAWCKPHFGPSGSCTVGKGKGLESSELDQLSIRALSHWPHSLAQLFFPAKLVKNLNILYTQNVGYTIHCFQYCNYQEKH